MEEFYIEYHNRQLGPFDMMSMIRKIRNGQLQRDTMILIAGDEAPLPAGSIEVFVEVFDEAEHVRNASHEEARLPDFAFMPLMKKGMEVLSLNLVMSVYTGVFLLLVSVALLIIHQIAGGIGTALLGSVVGSFLLCFYQLSVLRKIRMQLLNGHFFSSIIRRSGLQLLIVSLAMGLVVFGIPLLLSLLVGPVALALILLPGSLLLMWLFYAPILVADRGMSAVEAMRASYANVRSMGRDNFITLYMVMLTNFIGAASFLVPLILTLPISIAALCEVYDDYFNEFSEA